MNREKEIVKTSFVGIAGNILLVVAKAIIGILAGAVSIILDAVNNLTDALSSVITIIGTKLANKKPNKKHPYGFGRIEYLTSSIIGMIIFSAGFWLYTRQLKVWSPEKKLLMISILLLLSQ